MKAAQDILFPSPTNKKFIRLEVTDAVFRGGQPLEGLCLAHLEIYTRGGETGRVRLCESLENPEDFDETIETRNIHFATGMGR